MNDQVQNQEGQTASEPAKTEEKAKSVKSRFTWIKEDETDAPGFPQDVAGVKVSIGEGDNIRTAIVKLSDYADHTNGLALRGLREVLRNAVSGNATVDDAFAEYERITSDLEDGVFSDRGGGMDMERFAKVVAALSKSTQERALAFLEGKRAELSPISAGDKDNPEKTKWDVFVQQLRSKPEYREKSKELFPDENRGRKKGPKVEDLLGGLT